MIKQLSSGYHYIFISILLGAASSFAMEKLAEVELARNLATIEKITTYDSAFKTRLKRELVSFYKTNFAGFEGIRICPHNALIWFVGLRGGRVELQFPANYPEKPFHIKSVPNENGKELPFNRLVGFFGWYQWNKDIEAIDILKKDPNLPKQEKIMLAQEGQCREELANTVIFEGTKYRATQNGLEITYENGETEVKSIESGILCSNDCRDVKEVLVTDTAIYALTCCTLCVSHDGGEYFQVSIVGTPSSSTGSCSGEPIKNLRVKEDHIMATGWHFLKPVPCDLGTENEIKKNLERARGKCYLEFLPYIQCKKELR